MKITSVMPFVLHDGWRNLIFVEVVTDSGLIGIGEATLANRTEAVISLLESASAKHVIGSDPFDTESLWHRLYLGDFIRGGMIACAVLSAIDIACHDIIGKALGVPVYKLIGGRFRDKIPCYANGWYTVERSPEAIGERAKVVADAGYKALKIDPFGAGSAELSRVERGLSVAIVRAIRESLGPDFDIYVEGHGRFTPMEAIRIARLLEPYDIGWFEEPCSWDDPLSWREVRERSPIPIAGGEHFCTRYGYRAVIEARCVDVLQSDVLYCGGLTEMRKICGWADAYGILVAPHNSQGPVCTAATAHFAVGLPNLKVMEVFDDFMPAFVKGSVPGCPDVTRSTIALSDRPGLGIELDHVVIGAHAYKPVYFNLFAQGWERRFEPGGHHDPHS